MMTDGLIREDLLKFVGARVPAGGAVTADTDLLEEDLLDSLLIMDVVAHVERSHGVKLDNADIAPRNFRTVGAIANLVSERKS
jgi:acyl carrier protein